MLLVILLNIKTIIFNYLKYLLNSLIFKINKSILFGLIKKIKFYKICMMV